MKKIVIVNNNMKVGGVQKSLYNLLWAIDGMYDITLVLFRAVGPYAQMLPASVRVVECSSLFRYLGLSQGECRARMSDRLKRGGLAAVCRTVGRETAMRPVLHSQNMLPETYDCAISFLHNGRRNGFYGGCQDFVLNCIRAERKVAFLHCDYHRCGADHPENNRMMERFDRIAACSDGCRKSFVDCVPGLREKCTTVRNCHRIEEILALAEADTVQYDADTVNIVMVSRLTHEKGIERAITAVSKAADAGYPVRLHIVGDGPLRGSLQSLVAELGIQNRVFFCGEQSNPYRHMKNADLFLMTSYHEAAPLVIEEARVLCLPVLTTETTSSYEMVANENAGWVCENTQYGLDAALQRLLENRSLLSEKRSLLEGRGIRNDRAVAQFVKLIEG